MVRSRMGARERARRERGARRRAVALVLTAALGSCGEEHEPPGASGPTGAHPSPAPVRGLPDVAAARGLVYVNRCGAPEKETILEANGAGVALLDLSSDGDQDVVFAQGLRDLPALLGGPGADLEVYANDGHARFERTSGPGLDGWWTGLATGDLDGDGRTDLVAGAFGDLVVLLQDGRGRLVASDAAASGLGAWLAARPGARLERAGAGAGAPDWFTSLALFDADRDGALDLYAARYLDLDPRAPPRGALGRAPLEVPCTWKGHPVYCGPRGMRPQPDALLSGSGTGAFRDRSAEWLPAHEPGFSLAVAPFDADMDGDTDVYVACDSSPNLLLVNELRGSERAFVERARTAGVAVDMDGELQAGMGAAAADVDGDGLPDLAVTNFSEEPTQLYLGAPRGYRCVTYSSGLAHRTRRLLSWGVHLVDLDGDGALELFTANGHVYPQADLPGTGTSYAQPDSLFRLERLEGGLAVRPFEIDPAPSLLDVAAGSRGSAIGDLDGDGAPEIVVVRIDAPCGLGLNGLAPQSHRLLVRCLGPLEGEPGGWSRAGSGALPEDPRTPPDGKGTRLVLVPEPGQDGVERAILCEVQTATGYLSASSEWVAFGLGATERYRSLTLLWPSGRVETLPAGEADRRLTVREGVGLIDAEPLR